MATTIRRREFVATLGGAAAAWACATARHAGGRLRLLATADEVTE